MVKNELLKLTGESVPFRWGFNHRKSIALYGVVEYDPLPYSMYMSTIMQIMARPFKLKFSKH